MLLNNRPYGECKKHYFGIVRQLVPLMDTRNTRGFTNALPILERINFLTNIYVIIKRNISFQKNTFFKQSSSNLESFLSLLCVKCYRIIIYNIIITYKKELGPAYCPFKTAIIPTNRLSNMIFKKIYFKSNYH